jgi:spore coat protein U-like protein
MKKSFVGFIGFPSLALPVAVQAATAIGALSLSLIISASCSVVSASAFRFGSVAAVAVGG